MVYLLSFTGSYCSHLTCGVQSVQHFVRHSKGTRVPTPHSEGPHSTKEDSKISWSGVTDVQCYLHFWRHLSMKVIGRNVDFFPIAFKHTFHLVYPPSQFTFRQAKQIHRYNVCSLVHACIYTHLFIWPWCIHPSIHRISGMLGHSFLWYRSYPTPNQITKSENRQGIDNYLNISDYM